MTTTPEVVVVDTTRFWNAARPDAIAADRGHVAPALNISRLPQSVALLAVRDGDTVAGLMASNIEHWVDHTREGLLHAAFCHAAEDDRTLSRVLVDRLLCEGRQLGWAAIEAQLRSPFAAVMLAADGGWTFSGFKVRKLIDASRRVPALTDMGVRRALPEDDAFVLQCLSRAAVRGLTLQERQRVTADQVSRAVHEQYLPVLHGGGIVLIGEIAGAPVAHATLMLGPDRVDAHLVDIFVVAEHEGQGIARHLAAAAESEATSAGCKWLTGTVMSNTRQTASEIVEELAPAGWTVDAVFARRDLL